MIILLDNETLQYEHLAGTAVLKMGNMGKKIWLILRSYFNTAQAKYDQGLLPPESLYRPVLLWFVVVICVGITIPANAQIKSEVYKQTNASSNKADIDGLVRQGKSLFKSNQADSAIKVMLHALKQSSLIRYRQGMDTSVSYVIKYLTQWNRTNAGLDEAAIVQKSIDYMNVFTHKDVRLSWLYDVLGGYFFDDGRYAQGLMEYEKGLRALPDDTSDVTMDMKTTIYTNLSGIWAMLGEEQEALRVLGIAEEIALRKKNYHRLAKLQQHKGILYFNNDNFDSAYILFKASLALGNQYSDKHPAGCKCRQYTIANLSQVFIKQNKTDDALGLIYKEIAVLENEKAQRMQRGFKEDGMGLLMAFLKYLEGYAYFQKGNFTRAEHMLQSLLSVVKAEGISNVEGNIHQLLAALYDSTGNYKKAYQHKSAFADLETDHKVKREKSKLLALRYAIDKVEAMGQKQLLISRQRAELKEKNLWIAGVSLGTLLLCTSLLAMYRNSKNKQNLQDSLIVNLKQETEITQLRAKVEGKEQERSRIAHELHDGIVSQLLALKLNVNALQVNNNKKAIEPYQLNDIALQLEEATQDLRRTAHNLMPDLLLQQGLSLSVAALMEKINRNTGIEADFQAYGTLPRLSQDTELALYRMVQELVQNVLKHAGATQLLVQLSCRDNLLGITVEDNGKGIPVTNLITVAKSSGLANVKKRVELLGGQIDIKSKQGVQTTVYLEFDLLYLAA